jgi:ssRNA-specific RNase YbeY (16S rRNA maturation enzyme)
MVFERWSLRWVIMHVLIHVFGFDVVKKESKQEIMSMDQRGVRECGEASI